MSVDVAFDGPRLAPLHMGALHPVETVLTLGLAFGPFLVLGAVLFIRGRRDEGRDDGGDDPVDTANDNDDGAGQ